MAKNRGGARFGAGRPRIDGEFVKVKLSKELVTELDRRARKDRISRPEYIRQVLSEHIGQGQLFE